MEIYFGLMTFIFGLCFGSFVNMLVYRTAIKYRLEDRKFKVKNDKYSYCDGCGRKLTWKENIPFFSWVLQKGKTVCCNKNLPILYPVVEIGLGIIFVIFFINNKYILFTGEYLNYLTYFVSLIVIVLLWFSSVFDFKYYILPDFSTFILVFLAIFLSKDNLINSLIAGALSFLFVLILHKIKIKGNEAMGGGDVKLALFMGILLGGQKVILAFYIAFILGALIGIFLMSFKKVGKGAIIPFGPFLIFATFVVWVFGDYLLNVLFLYI